MSDALRRFKSEIFQGLANPTRIANSENSVDSCCVDRRGVETTAVSSAVGRSYRFREQANQMVGADPKDLQKIADWAKACNLKVLDSNPAQRRVLVEGSVADTESAFGTELKEYESPVAASSDLSPLNRTALSMIS